jgi:hypothetical protein
MANEDQLALLKRGVAEWNAWRKEDLTREINREDRRHVRMSEARGQTVAAFDSQ